MNEIPTAVRGTAKAEKESTAPELTGKKSTRFQCEVFVSGAT